jgi:hypothetical protein
MKEKIQQIRQVHAGFIHAVVHAVHTPEARPEIEQLLKVAEQNGWHDIVRAVKAILAGRRDESILMGLDEEDHAIVSGILEGLQNPAYLPDPEAPADAAFAAPGLATMINLAARGQVQALQALGLMGEQMTAAGGEMAQLAGRFRVLIDGERDAEKLTKDMLPKSRSLMLSILDELAKLDKH